MLLADARDRDLEPALAGFRERGYARLGPCLDEAGIAALRARADAIMLGEIVHEGLFFQKDTTTGQYGDLGFGRGWEGPGLHYRKIEKLERDPLFRAWIENPLFERIARRVIDEPHVVLYRAVLMTKSASGGTELPWHQDGGRFWGLDRDPTLQIWTALDDAPAEAGCVELVPGSHAGGLATPLGGMIPADVVARSGAVARAIAVPARAGEALLIHNHVWHRSGVNRTGRPRRALTVCYMPASTRCLRTRRAPRSFVRVFEEG